MKNEEFIEQVFHLVFGELYKKKEMTLFPIQEMFTKEELIKRRYEQGRVIIYKVN